MLLLLAFVIFLIYLIAYMYYKVAHFFVSAAPFAIAAILGSSAQRMNGWLVFFIWLIVFYSLSSYPSIRRGIAFACAALCSGFIEMTVMLFFGSKLPDSGLVLSLILSAIMLAFTGCSLIADYNKMQPFCIDITKRIHLPIKAQYAIASICYGFGVTVAISNGFTRGGMVPSQDGIGYITAQIILWVASGIGAYYMESRGEIDKVLSRYCD